jgi:hypothetical protein
MARFRSNKRAKELQRKAKHEAKEARKRERQERSASGVDDDIDWSQAVGVDPPPGWRPPGEAAEGEEGQGEETDEDEDAATTKSAS